MFRKTVNEYRRIAKSWRDGSETHTERVRRETWWFLFLPLYSREWIVASGL